MMKRWIWVVAVAASLGAIGCKKDAKKTEVTTTETKDGITAEKPAGGGGSTTSVIQSAMPTGVDRLLAALPADSEIVIGIDSGRLRSSALIGPMIDDMMAGNAAKMGFDIKATCGIDPTKQVGMGLVGIKMTSAKTGEFAGAFTGLDKATVVPCFEKARAEIEKNGFTLKVDGNYVFLTKGTEGFMGLTVTDDNIAMVRFSTSAVDKAMLEKMAGAKVGDGLTGSKEFMGMINATNTKATIWGLANGGSPLLSRLPAKFKAAFGSIDITDGIVVDGRMRMSSPDEATKVTQMFSSQLSSVTQMGLAKTATMTPDGADIKISVILDKKNVETLKNMVGAVFGSAMRGGMSGGPTGGGAPQPAPTPSGP